MKKISFVLFLVQSISIVALADVTYTTSTGAVFTQVQGPSGDGGSFGPAWKDPSGTIWSSYQGDYPNIWAFTERGALVDSKATKVCGNIGGTLPTAQDYQKLASYFDLYGDMHGNQLLTSQGQKDFNAIFSDMSGRFFWSRASLPGDASEGADVFSGSNGNIYYIKYLRTYYSIRCVGH